MAGWFKQSRQISTAFKDWFHDTPLRIGGWIMWLIAFMAGLVAVAIWFQQHFPPWYVWMGFAAVVFGSIMGSFIPYYRRSKTTIELFFNSDTCILRSPIYSENARGESEYTYQDNVVYMVGIKSTNSKQVENIEVKLKKIEPDVLHCGELVLNPRGITKGSLSTFTINRDDTKYVEVIEWYEPLSEAGIHSYENYNVRVRTIETNIPEGNYVFTLLATGNNVPRCEKQFQVTINNKSGIVFEEIT